MNRLAIRTTVSYGKPPFGGCMPGYKGYSPGLRENGGQYTHAAIWLAMGPFDGYDGCRLGKLLHALSPQGRSNDIYRMEPALSQLSSRLLHARRG